MVYDKSTDWSTQWKVFNRFEHLDIREMEYIERALFEEIHFL